MQSTHIPSLSIILCPDYTNSNLYSYILNGLLLKAFLSIAVIINKHFQGALGEVGNNLNTVIIYLFLHAGTKSFKGQIFSLLPSLS